MDPHFGQSLDPRMNRVPLVPVDGTFEPAGELDQFQTFQVFQQTRRGEQHVHVGIVHAPNPEMALLYAKEQYARRGTCVNLWVVRTADVVATDYADDDIFLPATDKSYREATFYKNREVIDEFKRRMDSIADAHFHQLTTPKTEPTDTPAPDAPAPKTRVVVTGSGGKKPVIIVGKKK